MQIENGFAGFARQVIRFRWLAIAILFGLSIGLGSLIPDIRVDNSDESFLKDDSPARIAYDRFQERFGREDTLSVIFQPDEIFDLEFLEKLRKIHREIEEEVPFVTEVTSLINARNTRGEGDSLIVEDLTENWPRNDEDLRRLRERVFSNPLYVNALIAENESLTVIAVRAFTYSTRTLELDDLAGFDDSEDDPDLESRPTYLTPEESAELVNALRAVVARHQDPDETLFVAGGPVIDQALNDIMSADMSRSLMLQGGMILIVLFLLFRRASGTVLPLVVVLASLVSTIGLMPILDIPFSITLNLLPALLLAVGICDSIHILTIIYQRISLGDSQNDAIVHALRHSGLAVVMTSLTTAAGLSSFAAAELTGVAHLGIVAPIGVLFAMIYSLVLLPAIIAVIPLRTGHRERGMVEAFVIDHFLLRLGRIATTKPRLVLGFTALLLCLSLFGIAQVRFSNDGLRWFPEDDPIRVSAELIDREFKGTSSLEVVVDTGRENGLHDPDVLARIEQAMRWSETLSVGDQSVHKAVSIVDIIKEINRALRGDDPLAYVVPTDRELIAQELLLFENSGTDDLEDWTDSLFQTARISIRTPWVDGMLYPNFVDRVSQGLPEILGENLSFEVTGGASVFSALFRAVILSMTRSYVIALAIITPLLVLLVGNLKRGLLAMIPNLIPIIFTIALMGWMDIPFDPSTLLIGGVILGVAVDDTIHFMHIFSRYYDELGDPAAAVNKTLATTGTALLFTSLVLSLGFAVFMTTYLVNTTWFGMLAAFATVVAFLADVLVAPALMVFFTPKKFRPHAQ